MVDYRRIFYLLKSPDFVRKVGGHAPDYPIAAMEVIISLKRLLILTKIRKL